MPDTTLAQFHASKPKGTGAILLYALVYNLKQAAELSEPQLPLL